MAVTYINLKGLKLASLFHLGHLQFVLFKFLPKVNQLVALLLSHLKAIKVAQFIAYLKVNDISIIIYN